MSTGPGPIVGDRYRGPRGPWDAVEHANNMRMAQEVEFEVAEITDGMRKAQEADLEVAEITNSVIKVCKNRIWSQQVTNFCLCGFCVAFFLAPSNV